jgi:predicted ATPase/class 3 adenylate cyclase
LPSELPEVSGIRVLGIDRRTTEEDVFTGALEADGAPVRIRLYRAVYPTSRQLGQRRHATDIAGRLEALGGVAVPRSLVPVGFDLAVVTDAPGIDELDRWMALGPSYDARLAVATSLARALSGIHGRGITHNALAPWRVAVDDSATVRIGGFERASSLRSEASDATSLSSPLTYASPEQTGRMNRPVDARSDLYALGVMLFELFAGHPPFGETDPLELVHAHVARPAPGLGDVAPGVSDNLAELVATLLEKDPDRRYRTAEGVAFDLDAVAGHPSAIRVKLRTRDVSDQLLVQERLYGREYELTRLADAFARATDGRPVGVWVAGYSGIGKSSLVHELEPLTAARFGWFAEGKFDLYQRDVPYLGWAAALADTVRQALAMPEADLTSLQAEVREALGDNAADLAVVVPAVSQLLGEQRAPEHATPQETHARLVSGTLAFIRAVATAARPLVVFLDDLQWADLASLSLLESVLSTPSAGSVLVVAAWRDNEVTADHPVRALLRKLDDVGVTPELLELPPLELEHVRQMIAEAVMTDTQDAEGLAEIVHRRTGGNPFFVRQFLGGLVRDAVLRFDRERHRWTWNLEQVATRSVTDNVAELLAQRLGRLPSRTLAALQAASIVGSAFTLSAVGGLLDFELADVALALGDALVDQLITPLDEQYRYASESLRLDSGSGVNPRYAFLHDRVREAAQASLDEAGRRALHLTRAQSLRDDRADDDTLMEMASHLCEATSLLVSEEARVESCTLLADAAERAKSAMALGAAARFLAAADELLPMDAWDRHFELALRLGIEAADVAYIDGRLDDVARISDDLLARTSDPLDRVPVHNILIGVGVASADYVRATEYAIDVLRTDFATELPPHPSLAQVGLELARCRVAIGRRSTEDLSAFPDMDDPRSAAVMGILMKTATNAYWAEPNLVPIIAAHMIRRSIEYGNHPLSAYGYGLYAMVTGGVLGAVRTAYDYGRLSMDLLERHPDRSLTGRTALLWHGFVRHSRDPLRECTSDLFDAYHTAWEAGDVENACYCATVGFYGAVLAGGPLPGLLERYGGYLEPVLRGGQEQTRSALAAWLQAVELLRGPTRQPRLIGRRVDWRTRKVELTASGDGTALPTEAAAAGLLAYLMDDLDEAEANLSLVYEHRDGAPGQVYLGPCLALYASAILRRIGTGRPRPTDAIRVPWLYHQVRARARHNPGDMNGFRLLVRGEARRAAGDRPRAVAAYLDAAEEARRGGVLYLQALALDEAGALEAAAGHGEQAAYLLRLASEAWRRLDVPSRATARVERPAEIASSDPGDPGEPGALGALDLQTLLVTMQAITREIEVDRIVERVLAVALKNAGASQGVLLLLEDGRPRPAAAVVAGADGSVVARATADPVEAPYLAPVVDYVVRTGAPILIEHAPTHELLRRTASAREASGSILCAPLSQGGTLIGAVYLSNPRTAGVFTPRQLVMVETICGQAAVSLANARLFADQRAQAESFARFVPRAFLDQLGRTRIMEVELGDAVTVDATVLFSDLRSFTEVSEQLSAVDGFELLNAYLGRMEPAIRRHGGFIDKYVGDAVMSLFAGGADGAVAAAVDMHRALEAFNAERNGSNSLRMGIGIHAGTVTLGTVGSEERLDTTAIGDTVNAASRLEGATKDFFGLVLVSRQALDAMAQPGAYAMREVGRTTVLGKTEVLEIHEVLAARPAGEAKALMTTRAAFAEALRAWYAGEFVEAAVGFERCASAVPADLLAARYAARCRELAGSPPQEAWRGIVALTVK